MAKFLGTIFLAVLLTNSGFAATNAQVVNYLEALKLEDYNAASRTFASPAGTSETEYTNNVQSVAEIISAYHKKIGKLDQADIKVAREGNYANVSISVTDENFAMDNPPTNFVRVGVEFAKAGMGFITFMLATINGREEIIFVQYEYPAK